MINFIRYNTIEGVPLMGRSSKRNPIVGAAIIAGASSILGGLIGSSSQEETNRNNYQIAAENRVWQERMINQQNEYNSPVAQKERYEEAGINPYMAMSNGQLSSGNQTSVPQSQIPTMQNAGQFVAQSFMRLGEQVQNAANSIFENNLKSAQTLATLASRDTTLLQNSFFRTTWQQKIDGLNLQIANMSLENQQRRVDLDTSTLQYTIQQKYGMESANWNLTNLKQDYFNKLVQNGLIKNQSELTLAQVQTERSKLNLIAAQVVDAYASAALKNSQAINEQDKHALFLDTREFLVNQAQSQALINSYQSDMARMDTKVRSYNILEEKLTNRRELRARYGVADQQVNWEKERGALSTFGSLLSPIFKLGTSSK